MCDFSGNILFTFGVSCTACVDLNLIRISRRDNKYKQPNKLRQKVEGERLNYFTRESNELPNLVLCIEVGFSPLSLCVPNHCCNLRTMMVPVTKFKYQEYYRTFTTKRLKLSLKVIRSKLEIRSSQMRCQLGMMNV